MEGSPISTSQQKMTKELLLKNMQSKIAKIPNLVSMTHEQKLKMAAKNQKDYKSVTKDTFNMMQQRVDEANEERDDKKRFDALTVQRGKLADYSCDSQIKELQIRLEHLKGAIPEEDFVSLKFFSELSNPDFWEDKDFQNKDYRMRYYRDGMGFEPKHIVKFLEYIKLWKKMQNVLQGNKIGQ